MKIDKEFYRKTIQKLKESDKQTYEYIKNNPDLLNQMNCETKTIEMTQQDKSAISKVRVSF